MSFVRRGLLANDSVAPLPLLPVLECAWRMLMRELSVHIAEIAYNLGNTLLAMMASSM
jgi:hypothetical protein